MISSNKYWLPKKVHGRRIGGSLSHICVTHHALMRQGGRTEEDNMRRLGTGRPEVLQICPGLGSLGGCYFGTVSFGESQARDSDSPVCIL